MQERLAEPAPRTQEDENEAQSLSRQLARLAAIHRINRVATASLNLEEILQTVVTVVAEAAGMDTCAVYLYTPEENVLTLRATVGLNPAAVGETRMRLGAGITGQAARNRQVIATANAPAHPDYIYDPQLGEEPYQSHVSVPLLLGPERRLIGVLNCHKRESQALRPDEEDFLRTVAGELAIAIENAQLYGLAGRRLRRKVRELTTLQHISATLASTIDLAETLGIVAEQACDLARAERVEIYRARGEHTTLLASNGERLQPFDRASVERALSVVMGAPQDGEPFGDDGRGLMCLPLRSARGILGGICLRFRPDQAPHGDQLALLRAFSNMAAVAIERAELHQEAKRSLEVKSALLQEMHHRVRNNLQTVAALLSMQARRGRRAEWSAPLHEAVNRIGSIAAVHDLLSREDIGHTTIAAVAQKVVEEASATLVPRNLRLTYDVPEHEVTVPSRQATILALLINELVANAIGHGFDGRQRGHLSVIAEQPERGTIVLRVADDGQGPPDGFALAEQSGLGLTIARTLVRADLHGTITAERNERGGTTMAITFPAEREYRQTGD